MLFAVAGKSLSALLARHPKMPSEAILSMLAQKGVSSMVNRAPADAVEAGAEGTSRVVEPDLEIVGEGSAEVKEDPEKKSKKRVRKDGAPPRYHHYKKPKDTSAVSGGGSSLKTAIDRSADVDHFLGRNVPGKKEFLQDFKSHLDQVVDSPLVFLLVLYFVNFALTALCFSFLFSWSMVLTVWCLWWIMEKMRLS